ncbi:hypothetical protein FTUN_5718 [Frigoriglobus tundricola]|uniref:Uncharacterized protein n=1 Tax=Frigoriglobus tundricola TaxID=2774151 RepID=A0A6M5YW34_9BACT|nr:hypothetical protein FTUN_5718 [Frigoriglobus tundricola]
MPPEKGNVREELSVPVVDLTGADERDGLRSFLITHTGTKPTETSLRWSATIGPWWTGGSSCAAFFVHATL